MKANKDTALFTMLAGSRLYGTHTDKSDYDYKTVCLPSLDTLLLNIKVTNRKEKPEGMKAGDRMTAGETETEYLPLQVFFDDFYNGQTYAVETAFAAKDGKFATDGAYADLYATSDLLDMKNIMEELVTRFLNRNVKKMVGYAISQAKMYGVKNERYTTLVNAVRILKEAINDVDQTLKANDELVANLLALPHVKVEKLAGSGSKLFHAEPVDVLNICGKQYYYTVSLQTILTSVENTVATYGKRVTLTDKDDEGVDWKALSHAVRITEQILELCNDGKLTLPRPNADYLLQIKNGELSLPVATGYLENAFNQIDDAIANSVLKERNDKLDAEFKQWKVSVLSHLYDLV
jgi:hypothetical protein